MSDENPKHSDFGLPIVRHFIACDHVEMTPDKSQYSLLHVIHAIKPLPGAAYPRIHPQLCLFVQMTDGRGKRPFQIQLVYLDDGETTYTSKPVILDLGTNPLKVHGWPIRLNNILFERPGLYEFRLLCDGQILAREPIILRENS